MDFENVYLQAMSIIKNITSLKKNLPSKVELVAVSKTKPVSDLSIAYQTGQRHFGENKVQELVEKYEQLPNDIHWHMIGHLQSNKVKYIASFVHLIHTVDSLKLLTEINKPKKQRVTEGVDFLKVWESIKPVFEAVKTTHEDPLVVTKDEDGNIHTHANLSVANAIHGTDVKHQAIHTGKPVQGGKFTFELSKHHEGALKEDAPFDPVAHKKEHDKLMAKHMAAHTETSKLINAKAPQEAINKAQERNNAVKAEIRAHKDKVPKGPAKKDGGPGDYYASKKPGEYTGD